jgi:hypothetical protein
MLGKRWIRFCFSRQAFRRSQQRNPHIPNALNDYHRDHARIFPVLACVSPLPSPKAAAGTQEIVAVPLFQQRSGRITG